MDKVEVGGIYRFKSGHTILRNCLIGKRFKVLSHDTLEAYNSDGSVIVNDFGFFVFSFTEKDLIKKIDWSITDINPLKRVSKHKFVV